MRIIFEKSLAVIVFLVTYLHGAAPVPLASSMIAVPANANQQLTDFIYSYNNDLVPAFSTQLQAQSALDSAINSALSIDAFMQSIYAVRVRTLLPNAANSQSFLIAIRVAHHDINQFACNQPNQVFGNYLRQTLQEVLKRLNDRYALAKIEDKVITGSAFMGSNALNDIPNNFQNTIRLLTGRIFVVKAVPGNQPYITGSSSAIIIPRAVGNSVLYDQIITCCHSMVAGDAESPYLEFYFVRSENINPDTGLPYPAAIAGALNIAVIPQNQSQINTQNFIQYLRNQSNNSANNNEVRCIASFTSLNRHASCLECHSPKYDYAADCGYGLLNAGFTFELNALAPIRIHQGIPAGNYNYYAIGYPGFDYYSTANLGILAQECSLSPFTITRNSNLMLQAFLNNNNQIQHDATTAPGMSGGPLLKFNNNTIEVFGVISSGDMNGSYACRF